jgi:predicted metal-dependent TIM-barrel fold hydrolase
VGGINTLAVEMAARSGARIVWFPTVDSAHEQQHVFSPANRKLPYWAQILTTLKEEGINSPVINIVQDGTLIPSVYEVLDTIAKHQMILATSHISHEETFALVKEAKKRKVERIIITHVDFPSTFYTVEEQKELAEYGAYMEHCYTTWDTGKVDFEETLHQIQEIGADKVLLTTDLGQAANVYPDEGLLKFCVKLLDAGFSEADVRKMCVSNPETLLAK